MIIEHILLYIRQAPHSPNSPTPFHTLVPAMVILSTMLYYRATGNTILATLLAGQLVALVTSHSPDRCSFDSAYLPLPALPLISAAFTPPPFRLYRRRG
jgi:hypothetical protein